MMEIALSAVQSGTFFSVEIGEIFNIGIGIGVGLKIGDITDRTGPFNQHPTTCVYLLRHRRRTPGHGIERGVVAEGAAPRSLAPVSIGAGQAGIDGQLMHPLTVTTKKILTECVDVIR